MLWYDQWFEGLEEASRIYKIANDPKGMIAHLDRLHDMVEKVRNASSQIVLLVHVCAGASIP